MGECGRWANDPRDWRPDLAASVEVQWHSLVRHLLGPHGVPPPFAEAWFVPSRWPEREAAIHAHLAGGGSIRDLPGVPRLRKSAAALLWQSPPHVRGLPAVRFAQLRALRCGRELIRVVMNTRAALDFSNDGIWIPLFEKMRDTPALRLELVPMVIDGLQHVARTQGSRRARELLRLPMGDLVRHWQSTWRVWLRAAFPSGTEWTDVERRPWCRRRIITMLTERWPGLPDIDPWGVSEGTRRHPLAWSVVELTTLRELISECVKMRHCVDSYAEKCRAGRAAIFHVGCRRAGEEVTSLACTLEVDPATRRLVQCRARHNRRPAAETAAIVHEWAREHRVRH